MTGVELLELSIESLERASIKLAEKIEKQESIEAVVFLEQGGYLIGKSIANHLNVPLIGIRVQRKGSKLKELVSPVLQLLPRFIKKFLRELELKSGTHNTNSERMITPPVPLFDEILKNCKSVAIVDDSIDTGHSIVTITDYFKSQYPNISSYVIGALNVWSSSRNLVKTDLYLWEDTILVTPMSRDSKDYNTFTYLYGEYEQVKTSKGM